MGNYTRRQLSAAAAFTIFCHAEIENYLESWSSALVDKAEQNWKSGKTTRILVHLCTFHKGRENVSNVPANDIWSEPVLESIRKHRGVITSNKGIKEANVCNLFVPLGFDVRQIDVILLGDLTAFGAIRGDYAHQSHSVHIGTHVDPFEKKAKADKLVALLEELDRDLTVHFSTH